MRAPRAALLEETERMSVRRLAPKELQPASFAFTEENLAWAKKQMEKYPPGRQASAVIAIMWRGEGESGGWGGGGAVRALPHLLGMPPNPGLQSAPLFPMFPLQPGGQKAHHPVFGP